jgi:hypothetical protein
VPAVEYNNTCSVIQGLKYLSFPPTLRTYCDLQGSRKKQDFAGAFIKLLASPAMVHTDGPPAKLSNYVAENAGLQGGLARGPLTPSR